MTPILEGTLKGSGKKIGIVISRFNEFITQRLLTGCLEELKKQGVKSNQIPIAWVPGSMELSIVALKLARKKNIDAVICLGAILRGDTFHFELVAYGTTSGIVQAGLMTGKPVIFGVLSTDTIDQAYQRSQAKGYNKGRDAARNALEMIDLLSQIK